MEEPMLGEAFDWADEPESRVYPVRVWHLAIFCAVGFTNQLIWISFSPIADTVKEYFDVSALAVDALSLVYLAMFPFSSLAVGLAVDKFGMQTTFRCGVTSNAVGATLRWCAVCLHLRQKQQTYMLVLVGQLLCAVSQPVFTILPVRLATTWFRNHDVPTMVASLSTILGGAFGQILPPMMVSDSGHGLALLLFVEAVISLVYVPAVFFKFDEAPPLPPTRASAKRDHGAVLLRSKSSIQRVHSNLSELLRNVQFLKLMGTFGVGLGIINTLLTMTSQVVGRSGYSDDQAGILGAVLLVIGLFSAFALSVAMDSTKAYGTAIRGGYFSTGLSLALVALALRPGSFLLLLLSFGALGICAIPMVPVTLETAAEITYPCPDELSSGVLMTSGQIWGIIFIFLMDYMLKYEGHNKTTLATPLRLFLMFTGIFVGFTGLTFHQGESKRTNAESHVDNGDLSGTA